MGSSDEAYAELDDKERIYVEEEAEGGGIAYTYARRAYVPRGPGYPTMGLPSLRLVDVPRHGRGNHGYDSMTTLTVL